MPRTAIVSSILPALLLAVITPCALANAGEPTTVTADVQLSGYFRPGAFLPVDVTISTGSRPVDGRLLVTSDTLALQRNVSMPAPSQRTFRFMLAPHSLYPVIEVRLVSQGMVIGSTRIDTLRAVQPQAALALLVGAPPALFASLADAMPVGSEIAASTMGGLPEDPHVLDAIDLLILADLASEPAPQQIPVIRQWLSGGGSMLVVLPHTGISSAAQFWQRFLPIGRFTGKTLHEAARELERTGFEVVLDDRHADLLGFAFGLGRVVIVSRGDSGRAGIIDADTAAAAVEMLRLKQISRREASPLLAREIYGLFEPLEWPVPVRRRIWIAALGYAAAMAVVLKVFHRERKSIFAASIVGFTLLFGVILYFGLLPRSNVVLQNVSVASTRAGEQSLAVTHYINARAREEDGFTLAFEGAVKPLFFSERMLSHGPVSGRYDGASVSLDIRPGIGRVSCFKQKGVRSVNAKLSVEQVSEHIWRVRNMMKNPATGEPIRLSQLILTDGSRAVFIPELADGSTVDVEFNQFTAQRLGGVVHDNFARENPFRARLLRYWMTQPRARNTMHLLGWSETQMMPAPSGRFLLRQDYGTFWQIEL